MSEFNKLLESVKVGKKLQESNDLYHSEEVADKFRNLLNLIAQSVIGSEVVNIESVDAIGEFNDDYLMVEEFLDSAKSHPIDISKYLNKEDSEFFKGFMDYWEIELSLEELNSIKVFSLGNPAGGES